MAYGMKWIILLSVASALLLPKAAAGSTPQLTVSSRFDSEDVAYTPAGKVKIALREVQTEATGTQEPKHLSVFVLFDPTSKAFTWRIQVSNETGKSKVSQFKNEHAAFLKNGEIIEFWALLFRIYIRDYHGHASSMDDAESKALEAASLSIASKENLLGNGKDMRVVALTGINSDFLYPPMSEAPSIIAPKVTNVRWDEDKKYWAVTLEGRWKAEVTLDVDYNLASINDISRFAPSAFQSSSDRSPNHVQSFTNQVL